jgi:hypothetical protein
MQTMVLLAASIRPFDLIPRFCGGILTTIIVYGAIFQFWWVKHRPRLPGEFHVFIAKITSFSSLLLKDTKEHEVAK